MERRYRWRRNTHEVKLYLKKVSKEKDYVGSIVIHRKNLYNQKFHNGKQ